MDVFRRTDRVDAVLLSVVFLPAAAFLGYFGVRGLLLYIHGSRAAPADPFAFTVGILSALGLSYLTYRLWRREEATRVLLPTPLLLVGSLAALGGMVWIMILNLQVYGSVFAEFQGVMAAGSVGAGGMLLWWRRVNGGGSGS